MRSFLPRAFFFAILVVGRSWTCEAALLDSVGLVYSETFTDETTFPTTPDLNPRSFSGVTAVQNLGNGTQTFPLSNGAIDVSIAAAEGASSLEQVLASCTTSFAADETVGIRGSFLDFAAAPTGPAQMFTGVYLTSAAGASVYASLQRTVLATDPVIDTLILILVETGAGAAPYQFIALTPSARSAVEGGAPFTIDLLFDRTLDQAQASLTVGAETVETAAIQPNNFTGATITAPALFAGVANFFDGAPPFDLGRDDSLTVGFDSIQLFAPEPSAIVSAVGAIASLAALRRRQRSAGARA